jgi:hypothetical protein
MFHQINELMVLGMHPAISQDGWKVTRRAGFFTERRERTGRLESRGAMPAIRPYRRAIRVQGRWCVPYDFRETVKQDREPSPGPSPPCASSYALPLSTKKKGHNLHPGPGILTRGPFAGAVSWTPPAARPIQ